MEGWKANCSKFRAQKNISKIALGTTNLTSIPSIPDYRFEISWFLPSILRKIGKFAKWKVEGMARKDPELQAVEDELIETMQMLNRMPDRDRAFLAAGSRSSWPEHLREWWEYTDEDSEPRRPLSRREVARVYRMWIDKGCIVEAIRAEDRKLVALVAARKAGRMPGGFRWEDIWQALRGRLPRFRYDDEGQIIETVLIRVTSDAMRKRYEAAIERLSARMTLAQFGVEGLL